MDYRICKVCNEEKEECLFERHGKSIRNRCKECRNKTLRTGKPNEGRFKKGNIPKTHFKKGHVPVNKGKYWGNSRGTKKNGLWKTAVKERDLYKCVKCGTTEKLTVHHIKSWKEYPDLRFEISNGLTLCVYCHGKEEGPLNANNGLHTRFKKGHKHTEETRKKLSIANKGKIKGPMSEETKKKISDTKKKRKKEQL